MRDDNGSGALQGAWQLLIDPRSDKVNNGWMKELKLRIFLDGKNFIVESEDHVVSYGSDLFSALDAFASVYGAQTLLDHDHGRPTVWTPDELGLRWADLGLND